MTDLNELSQFEKDLKNLIDNRNNFKPEYVDINAHTKQMNMSEKGLNPLDEIGKHGIRDRGRPIVTRMAVEEHGKPYKRMFRTEKEEHDYMKTTCHDYCPNVAGQKCGRPGCSESIFSFC